jgi:hypothetical protein
VVELVLQLALVFDELVHLFRRKLFAEAGVKLVELAQGIDDLLRPLFDDGPHGARLVQQRLLFQEADGVAGVEDRLADVVLIDAGHDAQQAALARAVEAQHADLGPIEVGQRNVAQDDAIGRDDLAHADHGVDDFVVGHSLVVK